MSRSAAEDVPETGARRGRAALSAIDRLAVVARDLQSTSDPQATLDLAVRVAAATIAGADAATITIVRRDGGLETPASSHAFGLAGDLLQYTLGEGPCLKAVWDDAVVHADDLERDGRWPRWAPQVHREQGTASMLCIRLFTHADNLGALNLYSRTRAAFDVEARDEALGLAAHVAVAVAAARHIDQLDQALDSRTLISQATGMLMERYRLDARAAFDLLARVSSESNTKVRDLARQVVRGELALDR